MEENTLTLHHFVQRWQNMNFANSNLVDAWLPAAVGPSLANIASLTMSAVSSSFRAHFACTRKSAPFRSR